MLLAVSCAGAAAAVACSDDASTADASASDASAELTPDASAAADATRATTDARLDDTGASDVAVVMDAPGDAGCGQPAGIIVAPGGTLTPRPIGSALRLKLIYQGDVLAVTDAKGVDMVLPGSVGPFTPGVNAGHWYELRSASQTLYTRGFQDPTSMEVVGAEGGLSRLPVPFCSAKALAFDVPNDPAANAVVVFGSPYGTQGPAAEIARFTLP